MNFIIIGTSCKHSPAKVRDNFVLQIDNLHEGLRTLLSNDDLKEVVIFSNQERFEIYAVTSRSNIAVEKIKALLIDYHDLNLGNINNLLFTYKDIDAVKHLFNVALGFESLRTNDPDILEQLTNAFRYSIDRHNSCNFLNKIIEEAVILSESQKINRIKTQYFSSVNSIGFAAVRIATRIFSDFSHLKLLLIGRGEIAEDIAMSLINNGSIREFIVMNKSFDISCKKAEALHGKAVKIEHLFDELPTTDIVICSTGAPYILISKKHISDIMNHRMQRPILIIDISIPRNVDPEVNDINEAYLYDFDNMSGFLDENANTYEEGSDKIKSVINEKAELFWIEVMSMSCCSAGSEAVADLLFEDTFCLLTRDMSKIIGHDLVVQIKSEGSHRETECSCEFFLLMSFFISFIFQAEFEYLGKEKVTLIIDSFHHKLFNHVENNLKVNASLEQLKARYAEYYPAIRRDLDCLMNIDHDIPFLDVTKTFFKRIAPNKTRSPESLLFSMTLSGIYSLIRDSLGKVKEYKIE